MRIVLNFIPIVLAIVTYVLAGLFKSDESAHSGLLVLAGALAGWAIPRLGEIFKAAPETAAKVVGVALVVGSLLAFSAMLNSCTTPVKPDSFYGKVVTCTMDNTKNPQAIAAVVSCLSNVVQGDAFSCLQGLVACGAWTVEEVACIAREQAVSTAQKANASGASVPDSTILANANAFIRAENMLFRGAQ